MLVNGEDPESAAAGPGLDSLVDDYLLRLAEGKAPALEDYRKRVPAEEWPRFVGQARSGEYRWRLANGEHVRVEEFVGALPEEARAAFLEALEDGTRGTEALPLPIGPGTLVRERWVVARPLGVGGQGAVFEAWDRELEVPVALKFLNARGAPLPSHEWEETVRRESQLLARLQSRHIVRVRDVVRDGGRSFLVMDLVRGIELGSALARVPAQGSERARVLALREAIAQPRTGEHAELLDPASWYRSVARIAAVMARTVELAHAEGVVHRDLKPGNVLLVSGGEPVLLDFGHASRRDGNPQGFFGTPRYVAPEQARAGRSGVAPESDVYQLGAILYELLTLRQAFPDRGGEGLAAKLLRVERGAFEPPRSVRPEVPAALEAICLKAMARESDARYASAGELARDLERFVRGLPPRGARAPAWEGLGMRARFAYRHPAARASALALLVAVLLPPVFGNEGWKPPSRVQPVLAPQSGEDPLPVQSGQPLEVGAGAWLGIEVHCPRATQLYAFTIFGTGPQRESWVIDAVAPKLHGDVSSPALDYPRPLTLGPGRHTVICSTLADPAETEGMLLFFADEPRAELDDLQAELHARAGELRPQGYMEALEHALRPAPPTKGDSPGRLTVAERKLLFSPSGREAGAERLLERSNVSRSEFVFPVRKP